MVRVDSHNHPPPHHPRTGCLDFCLFLAGSEDLASAGLHLNLSGTRQNPLRCGEYATFGG